MCRRDVYSLSAAVILIVSGIVLLFLRTWIFDQIVSSAFVLSPNSLIMDFWKTPLPVNVDVYLFNWTNPEDILNLTTKPRFQQVGPYKFKLYVEKVNITWNPNDTVTFRMFQKYSFDEKNSVGKLTDKITTLNTVTVGAAHHIRNSNYFTKRGFSLSLALLSPRLDVTKTADELLFKGYEDPYVSLAQTMPFLSDTPSPTDRVGYFYGRNSSYTNEGIFNVATGKDGTAGKIMRWNYYKEVPQYSDHCKHLGGSVGDLYPQGQSRDYIKFFLAYACRNFILDYEKDVSVKGIHGYKFSASQNLFDNGTLRPENKCSCNGGCLPAGLINISECAYGSPTFLSLPHFYGADPSYANAVEGLNPEKSKHEFYTTVQPKVGACIDIALRLQLNVLLQPIEYITLVENAPKIFFPILWSEQKASVPEEYAVWLRILLNLNIIILPIISSILIIAGLTLVVFTKCRRRRQKTRKAKNVLTSLEETPLQCKNDVQTKKNTECIYN